MGDVTFKMLVNDDRIADTFHNLGKSLRAAKKKGILHYNAEGALFVGRHDHVVVGTTKMMRLKAAGRAASAARRRSSVGIKASEAVSLTEAYFASRDRIAKNEGEDTAVTEDEWANY